MIKFTECLNDTWDYFFLGDPARVSLFRSEYKLSENLISEFTNNESGDLIVEKGILIPMSGIANYPYHIIFQIKNERERDTSSIFLRDDPNNNNDLQFHKVGYFLEVINQEIYLLTIPYLKNWEDDSVIDRLKLGIRPKVTLENGFYTVEILGGEMYHDDSGWEPTIEFILQKKKEVKQQIKLTAEGVNFKFRIKSREY